MRCIGYGKERLKRLVFTRLQKTRRHGADVGLIPGARERFLLVGHAGFSPTFLLTALPFLSHFPSLISPSHPRPLEAGLGSILLPSAILYPFP